jgi:serine/threonine-protein kinase
MGAAPRTLPERIGRYEIRELVGQGAMGRVLLGHDPVLDRDVAVKLLRDDLKILPEQRQTLFERMQHEARASARVSHPNIIVLHDMGDDPDLGLYLVHEYAHGLTLKQRLLRGPLGPEAAAALARQIGDALTTAHRAGVLHRDIKPENIIMTATGAKIADFGIARIPDSTLTRDGGLLGTPAYSSPESIADGKFSPQSDQFSMAATMYEAISGRRAFPGDDAVAVASRITNEQPSRISLVCGLDPHVDDILLRGLSKMPRERFASCAEFGQTLAEALTLAPRTMMPTEPDAYHRLEQLRADRINSWRLIGIGVVFGALGAALIVQISRDEPVQPAMMQDRHTQTSERPVGWLSEGPRRADNGRDRIGSSRAKPAALRDAKLQKSASKRAAPLPSPAPSDKPEDLTEPASADAGAARKSSH